MIKRILAEMLVAFALAGLVLGPASWAADGAEGTTGPAMLDAVTDQLFDSQDPPHYLEFPAKTVTLTGHGTSTISAVDICQTTAAAGACPAAGTDGKISTDWFTAGAGTVGGTGTKNYLSKWTSTVTGTATSTAISVSTIYDDGTYVGIGRTNAVSTLDVNGDVRISGTDTTTSGLMGLAFTRNLSGPGINQDMVRDLTTITTTSTATATAAKYCSFDASPTFAGAGYYDHAAAFQNRIEIPGNASMRFTRGFLDYPLFDGTGTLADRWGFHVYDIRGIGAVTNNVGIKVEDLTRGTNDFAIYTGAGHIRVGDNISAAGGKAFYSMHTGEYANANKKWGSISSESTNGTMILTGGTGTYSAAVPDVSIASYNGTTLTKHIDIDVAGSRIKLHNTTTPTVNGGPAIGTSTLFFSDAYANALTAGAYSSPTTTTYFRLGSNGITGTKGVHVVKAMGTGANGTIGGANGTWADVSSTTYTPINTNGGASSGTLRAQATVQYSTNGLTSCSIRILINGASGDVATQTTESGYYATIPVIHPGAAIDNSTNQTIKVQITSNNASTCTATGSGYGNVMIFEQ